MNNKLEVPPTNDHGLPYGWFSATDIKMYQNLVQKILDESILVEVGVWQGRSICSIAEQIIKKNIHVFAIDTFKGTPGIKVVHDCNGKLQNFFESNINFFGLKKHVTIIRDGSSRAAKSFNNTASLIFLDGNHDPKQITLDINLWLPHIARKGILCGHDFSIVKKSVKNTLKSHFLSPQNKKNCEIWWTTVSS